MHRLTKQLAGAASLTLISFFSNADTAITLGTGVNHFDYREYSQAGLQLDGDKGSLHSNRIELEYRSKNYSLGLGYQRAQGDIGYQSLVGNSISAERISTTEITATRNLFANGPLDVSLSIYAGRSNWDRDIASTESFKGLEEDYQRNYFGLSAGLTYTLRERHFLTIDINASRIASGHLCVRFLSEDFDPTRLNVANGYNTGITASWHYNIANNYQLISSAALQRWEIEASEEKSLFKDEVRLSSKTQEPRSENNQLIYQIAIQKTF